MAGQRAERRIGVVGPVTPGIIGESGGLADRAQRAVFQGPRRRQRARRTQPVEERGGRHQCVGVAVDGFLQAAELGEDGTGTEPRHRAHAAGDHDAPAEPASAQATDQPQHPFLVHREPGGGHRQARRISQLGRDVDVVGDPLQFGVQDPHQRGRHRRDTGGDALDGVAVGQGVRDRGDTFGPLGEQHAGVGGHALEPLLDPAVLVEDPHVQVRYRLTRGLDQVLDGLHDAGPDRAVRDGEQAVALDVPGQRVVLRRAGQDQRGQPRMPLGDHAELIMDHSLVPERRSEVGGQGGIAGRAGRQGHLKGVDPARHGQLRREHQAGFRPGPGPVGGEQAGEPVPRGDAGYQRRP